MDKQKVGKKLFDEIGNNKYLLYILTNEKEYKHNKILALFCLLKKYKFDSYEELGFFWDRYGKAAKRLMPFSMKKIKATIEYLLNNDEIDFKVGIETIEKYIMDVNIPEDEVIITLTNGEKVMTTARLKELEKQNKIYYSNGKWYERN